MRQAHLPEHGQDEGGGQGQRGEDLRDEQELQPIDAVGEHAAVELEEHERHALREAEVAQRHRIVRDLPGQPGKGDVLRPVPKDVEDQPDPVEEIVPPGKGGEIQLTDGLAQLVRERKVYGCEFLGDRYDIGDKFGFVRATVAYALKRPDLKDKLLEYLKTTK